MDDLHKVLDFAKQGNFAKMFKALTPLKEHVNTIPRPRRFAVLHQAAFFGNRDVIYRLVTEFGADPEQLTGDEEPRSAQEIALEEGHEMTAQYLCDLVEARAAGAPTPEPPTVVVSPKKRRLKEAKEEKGALYDRIHGGTSTILQIDCVKYKRSLLQMATPKKAKKNGAVSLEAAEMVWKDAVESGGKVTDAEWNALKFILDERVWAVSAEAKEFLEKKLDVEHEKMIDEASNSVEVASVEAPTEKGASEIQLAAPPAVPEAAASSKDSVAPAIAKGDEIRIVTTDDDGVRHEEFYRVYGEKDGCINIGELLRELKKHAKVSNYSPRPLNWARSLGGMSRAFKDLVVNFKPDEQPSCQTLLKAKFKPTSVGYDEVFPGGDGVLPEEVEARQKSLIYAYTAERPNLYSEVTAPLRSNNRERMWRYAAYIRELQYCFRSGQEQGLLKPFTGTVYRSESLAAKDVEALYKSYGRGEDVTYASFTSTSASKEKALDIFKGRTVLYQIQCNKNGLPSDEDYYFPASIAEFSQLDEDEVLFPSQCKFRVVNMTYTADFENTGKPKLIINMETTEWPSVWDMIEQRNWTKLKTYAAQNEKVMEADNAKYSILGTIAEASAKHPDFDYSEAIKVCAESGANMDEVDPETGTKVTEQITQVIDKLGKDSAKAKNLMKAIAVVEMHGDEADIKYSSKGSYYIQEKGVKYVRALISIAASHGMIGKRAAGVLARWASKGRGLTKTKRATIERILNGFDGGGKNMELPHPQGEAAVKVRFTKEGRTALENFLKGAVGPAAASESKK